jgi:hypothetical protein
MKTDTYRTIIFVSKNLQVLKRRFNEIVTRLKLERKAADWLTVLLIIYSMV